MGASQGSISRCGGRDGTGSHVSFQNFYAFLSSYRRRNTPHQSKKYTYTHSTLKWIYSGQDIVGTLHVPGQNGNPVDMWASVGRKWQVKKVDDEFLPSGVIKFKYAEFTSGSDDGTANGGK